MQGEWSYYYFGHCICRLFKFLVGNKVHEIVNVLVETPTKSRCPSRIIGDRRTWGMEPGAHTGSKIRISWILQFLIPCFNNTVQKRCCCTRRVFSARTLWSKWHAVVAGPRLSNWVKGSVVVGPDPEKCTCMDNFDTYFLHVRKMPVDTLKLNRPTQIKRRFNSVTVSWLCHFGGRQRNSLILAEKTLVTQFSWYRYDFDQAGEKK